MTVRPVIVALSVTATVLALHLPSLLLGGVLTGLALLLALLVLTAVLAVARRSRPLATRCSTAALMCLLPAVALLVAGRWQAQLLPAACERVPVTVTGSVRGLPRWYQQRGDRLYRIELENARVSPARCAGPRRLRLYLANPEDPGPVNGGAASAVLQPGNHLRLQARLRQPWGFVNPGALSGERHYLLDGLHAVGSARLLAVTHEEGTSLPPAARIDRARLALSHWIREHTSAPSAALLAALAVGDQRFLEAQDWERLRLFGLTHLLVISGLHVSLLALPGWYAGSGLARVPGAGPWASRCLPPALALALAGGYSFLAGFSLPTQRAMMMLTFACLPRLAGRRVNAPVLLALVAALLVLVDPLSVLGASFWLSLGAVALLLWYVRWREHAPGLRAFAGAQLFMLAAMVPAGVLFFGASGSVGGIANLVAIPLVAFLVVPALLLALLLRLVSEPLASALLAVPALALEMLWSAMGYWEPHLTGGSIRVAPGAAALLLGLGAIVILVVPRLPHRALVAPLLLAPMLLASALPGPGDLSIVFFDVGQGTAVLVRDGDAAMLYDTGPGPPKGPPLAARTILPALGRHGRGALEVLVVSHPDQDHAAGEDLVRARFAPRRIRRGLTAETGAQRCRAGARERLGPRLVLQYLSSALPGDSDNNASCVVLVEARGRRFLLPGDIDAQRERDLVAYWGEELRADVLLAAHHGSRSSTSPLFLRAVDPRVVVFTAARASRFGHPAPEIIERVERRGILALNTAYDGAVEFSLDAAGGLRCRRFRHAWAPFWRAGFGQGDCSEAD